MKEKKFVSIKTKLGLMVGLGVFLTLAIIVIFASLASRNRLIAEAKESAVLQANNYSERLKSKVEVALDAAREFSHVMSATKSATDAISLSRNEVLAMMKSTIRKNKTFLGMGCCWEPNQFDGNDVLFINRENSDNTGRFIPYVSSNSSGQVTVEALKDYDVEGAGDYYQIPKKTRNEAVINPYHYEVNGRDELIITVAVPIMEGGNFYGITAIDYSIDFLQEAAEKKNLYGGKADISIVSNNGVYVANTRDRNLVGKNIKNVYSDYNKQLLDIDRGQKVVWETDTDIKVYVPVYYGKTTTPWQIRITVPKSLAEKQASAFIWTLIGIGLLLGLLSIGTLIFVLSKGMKRIQSLAELTEKFSTGDLGVVIEDDINDELGSLANSVNNMVKKLSEIVVSIIAGANNIASASVQISSTAQEMSQGASVQASSTEEVSSSMEEMGSNIQQNTDNAQQTEKISIATTDSLIKVSDGSKESLGAVKQITEKITIVNDIAFQTNILALNAAVEAARAGEHGKGFAVVAAEVRKLAERSKIAADEIVGLTQNSLKLTDDAAGLLSRVMPEIEKTSQLIQEINAASLEQNSGAEQINNAMQQLNQVTQQNAAASEEMATSSEELSSQAEQLKEVVAYFKINQNVTKQFLAKKTTLQEFKPEKKAVITQEKELNKSKGFEMKLNDNSVSDNEFESF